MRHFNNKPVDKNILKKLIVAAHAGPSVGFMQPWRFIRISDLSLRDQIYSLVNEERLATADALQQQNKKDDFLKLKVEGIKSCAEILVVTMIPNREDYIFGRRTLPEMDIASTACAIQNIWLAARAEGLGLGWVSIFDPDKLSLLLKLPQGSRPLAILCLGHVDTFYDKPLLETEHWDSRRPIESIMMENYWSDDSSHL
jgi:5,6-dimethylbenzimidazole synthase